jgi:hypothetical protein
MSTEERPTLDAPHESEQGEQTTDPTELGAPPAVQPQVEPPASGTAETTPAPPAQFTSQPSTSAGASTSQVVAGGATQPKRFPEPVQLFCLAQNLSGHWPYSDQDFLPEHGAVDRDNHPRQIDEGDYKSFERARLSEYLSDTAKVALTRFFSKYLKWKGTILDFVATSETIPS